MLYAPPAAENVQTDSSAAILEYYSTKKLHHKYGTIDLTKCEEVYSALDSAMYRHVFCIQVRTEMLFNIRMQALVTTSSKFSLNWVVTQASLFLNRTQHLCVTFSKKKHFSHLYYAIYTFCFVHFVVDCTQMSKSHVLSGCRNI